jgi:hypothetical protein
LSLVGSGILDSGTLLLWFLLGGESGTAAEYFERNLRLPFTPPSGRRFQSFTNKQINEQQQVEQMVEKQIQENEIQSQELFMASASSLVVVLS